MKAIILTFAPITEKEEKLLTDTKIFKLAINGWAEYLKPDLRIVSDYNFGLYILKNFPEKVVNIRELIEHERSIYEPNIRFKGSTLVAGVDYLISKGFKDILILGDNTVRQDWFQKRIKKEIDLIVESNDVNIYQYSNGNFNLKTKTVEQFIKESEV